MTVVDVPPELIGSSGLYNSPDPLIRRLRLEDQTGAPITDIDRWFRFKDIIVLYAGSEHGANNLKQLHAVGRQLASVMSTADQQDLATFAIRQHKTAAVIYVSTDVDPVATQRVLAQKPFLRMTFNDNSDFAPLATSDKAVVEDISRGEEFVQAGEVELGIEKMPYGVEEDHYVRPFSRAAMTMAMNAFSTPSIAIYHIPSHSFVSRHVRTNSFESHRIDANHQKWKNGGAPALKVNEFVWALRYPLFLLFLAVCYHFLIFMFGEEYNVIPRVLDQLNWRSRVAGGAGI